MSTQSLAKTPQRTFSLPDSLESLRDGRIPRRDVSSASLDEQALSSRRRGDTEEENFVMVSESVPTAPKPARATHTIFLLTDVLLLAYPTCAQAALMATEMEFELRSGSSSASSSLGSFSSKHRSPSSSEADVSDDWERSQMDERDHKRPKSESDELPLIGETPSFADMF